MKDVICIVAKTGRGKDTLAKQIKSNLGINQICSYTTRPKRDYETNGKEHWFISEEQAADIIKNETVLAYAKKPSGVEYFTTVESFKETKIVYIVDPEGIDWLRKNSSIINKVRLFVVELYAKDEDIESRIRARGDDWDTYLKRIENEKEEFERFHESGNPNVSIDALLPIEQVFNKFKDSYSKWAIETFNKEPFEEDD